MKRNSKRNRTKLIAITPRDKSKICSILLRVDNKEAFLDALVESLIFLLEEKNTQQFEETLEIWEASAEIDNIPGAKKRIGKAYKQYNTDKKVSRNWQRFKKQIGIA
ncbi:MAG: hypothetical protein KAW02_04480 [candidate division Zixibacteria bacterium]|nr:hypothetical protein [candidate division Zixibacteria bacterium]